jgi:hypothetical protein
MRDMLKPRLSIDDVSDYDAMGYDASPRMAQITEDGWLATLADRLVQSVHCFRSVYPDVSIDIAMEVVLSQSCAGPATIDRAMEILREADR